MPNISIELSCDHYELEIRVCTVASIFVPHGSLLVLQVLSKVNNLRKKVTAVAKEHASVCAKVDYFLIRPLSVCLFYLACLDKLHLFSFNLIIF